MKKKFLKNLAFALAAATVITAAGPAAASNAAAAPSLNQKAKNLYLNNDAVGKSFDFNVNNKVKGSKYKWSSSNTAVATVNNKNGVVTGKKVGTAKITLKITLPTKKTKTLTATVNVKKNATGVAINNVPEDKTIGIGEKAYNFNRNITDKDATDKTYWIIDEESNTAGATVNTANGVVSTTKAGEFKLTAYTYQNNDELKAKNWTATSETVTIKVAPSLKEAKQSTLNKVVATFDADMSKTITKDNITLTNATGVKQVIKSVSFSDDGKQVTVENFEEFKDKAVYKLTYSDKSLEITASKGEIASIAVVPKTVQYGTSTKFDVKLFDANGVDVTTKEKLADVTFEYDSATAFVEDLGSDDQYKIYMYNYDTTATVKATYHTYTYVNSEEVKFESPAVTFNAVKEIKDQASEILATFVKNGNPDWNNIKKSIAAEDEYVLHIKAKDKNDKDLTAADFTFESTDDNIVTVYKSSSDVVTVYGMKQGTAHIKATYGDTVKMIDVTVGAKSKVTTLSADRTNVTVYALETPGKAHTDSVILNVTAKDQYGDEIATVADDFTVTHRSGDASGSLSDNNDVAGEVEFIVDSEKLIGTSSNKAGSNQYDITYKEKTLRVTVNVVQVKVADQKPAKLMLDRTSAKVNSAVDEKGAIQEAKFVVGIYNSRNQKIGTYTGTNETFKVTFENEDVKTTKKTAADYSISGNVLTFKAGKTKTGLVSAKKGTYVVEFEGEYETGKTTKLRANISVTNDEKVPTTDRKDNNFYASNVKEVVEKGVKLMLNGVNIMDDVTIVSVDSVVGTTKHTDDTNSASTSVSAGDTVNIQKIVFTRDITVGTQTKTIEQTVELGLSFKVK